VSSAMRPFEGIPQHPIAAGTLVDPKSLSNMHRWAT
jgi:hypothetical protein